MKTVTFTEFRNQAAAIFDIVEKGRSVKVLRHGKPVAFLVPIGAENRLPAWKLPATRLKISGVSLAQAIIDERRSSR